MDLIKVRIPVAELAGDEMARITWGLIEDKLILPYLDIDLKYCDAGIEHRDQTDDRVTSMRRTPSPGTGSTEMATITPDEARVKEFDLGRGYRGPNGTPRGILDGTIFGEPTICENLPRLVPGQVQPILVGGYVYSDAGPRHRTAGARKVAISDQPEDGQPRHRRRSTSARLAVWRWPFTTPVHRGGLAYAHAVPANGRLDDVVLPWAC